MKCIAPLSLLTLSLLAGTALAAGQSNPPGATKATTDHSHMQHGQMDQGNMKHRADGGQNDKSDEFTTLDANKDDVLSKAELAKHRLAPHFDMLDANKDGKLSPAEFATGQDM